MAIDIKTIVGKEALTGLDNANTKLKESNTLIKEQIGLLDSLNKEYSETKNATQLKAALNKQEQASVAIKQQQSTTEKNLTKLEQERLKIETQKKKVFAEVLALNEADAKVLLKGQILKKKKIAQLKEEITGEKAAKEALKAKALAEKENTAAVTKARAAALKRKTALDKTKVSTVNLITALRSEITTEKAATASNKTLLAIRKSTTTATEKGRKQITLINKKIDKNNKLLKTNASQLGKTKIGIGEYERGQSKASTALSGFGKKIIAGGLAMVGFRKVMQGVGNVIQSTQGSGDKFNITLQGMRSSYDAFNKSLASGDLKNVFKNMEEAFKAGKAYATIMDDLGDRERDLAVTRSESKVEIEKLTDAVQNVTKSDEDRIEAAKKIFTIEKGLLNQSQSVRQQDYDAQVKLVSSLTGMKDDQILHFIKNYDEEKKLREKAVEITQLEADVAEARGNGWVEEYIAFKASLDKKKAGLTDLEKAYVETYKGYSKTTDEELDKVVASYVALQDAESSSIAGMRRIKNQYNTLVSSLGDSAEEGTVVVEKSVEDEFRIRKSGLDRAIDLLNANATKKKDVEGDFTTYLEEQGKKQTDANVARIEAEIAANKKKNEKEEDDDKKSQEKRRAIRDEVATQIQSVGDGIFDYKQNLLDMELDALQTNYDAQIEAAGDDTEKKKALVVELANKQHEIQLEQAKSERKQALFDIAISTAIGTVKAYESGPAGIALAAITAAAGLAQAALVMAEPLPSAPQYATGIESSAATFVAGEKGRELMITKDGKMMLTPNQATVYDGMSGTKVIPNSQTEQVLKAVDMANAGVFDATVLANKLDTLNESSKMIPKVISQMANKKVYGRGGNMERRLNKYRN